MNEHIQSNDNSTAKISKEVALSWGQQVSDVSKGGKREK